MQIGRREIETIKGTKANKRFIYDKDSGTFIIRFEDLVGFLHTRETKNLKKVKRIHIPIHLITYVDKHCSNIIVTNGLDYEIVINPMDIEKDSNEVWLRDIINFIAKNYEKF